MESYRSADMLQKLRCTIGGSIYQLFAVSVKGPGKDENQDNYGYLHFQNSLSVVVADGLGSAKQSKMGSQLAVESTLKIINEISEPSSWPTEIFKEWRSRIIEDVVEYDTTNKFIKIMPEELVFGGIGDGWIYIKTESGYEQIVSNNLFSNQTDSMLSFDYKSKFIIQRISSEKMNTALISTDGFSEDIDKKNAQQFLEEIGRSIDSNPVKFGSDLLEMMDNWLVDSNKDDKTVVIIHKMAIE